MAINHVQTVAEAPIVLTASYTPERQITLLHQSPLCIFQGQLHAYYCKWNSQWLHISSMVWAWWVKAIRFAQTQDEYECFIWWYRYTIQVHL